MPLFGQKGNLPVYVNVFIVFSSFQVAFPCLFCIYLAFLLKYSSYVVVICALANAVRFCFQARYCQKYEISEKLSSCGVQLCLPVAGGSLAWSSISSCCWEQVREQRGMCPVSVVQRCPVGVSPSEHLNKLWPVEIQTQLQP